MNTISVFFLTCWWSNWEDQSPTHLETGKIPEGFSHSSLTFNYYYTESSTLCQDNSLSFFIFLKSSIVTHHQLSNIGYPHTEWIFFVPSKTERVAKGSIPSWSLWAQVRFKVDLPRIRSHSRQGVLMSSHLESSFLIAISSLTVLTISSVSIVIATLWVPLLRNKVFIIIVFTRGSWSEDPFLTHFNYYFTISSALCQVFYSFSLGIVSWGQLESLLLWGEIRGFVRGFERRFEKVWAWMKITTAHPV